MNIEHLGKGAIRQPKDSTTPKFRHTLLAQALPPVNWTSPYSNPEPISNDQGASSSCVGQGWSYYHEQLKPKRFSRRDIYAQIALPGGGARIYDGHERIVNFGQATRDEVPDPEPETEANMLYKADITQAKEASDKELDGLTVALDINEWAKAIKALKGVVGGLEGTNAGWTNLANPSPPPPNSAEWGHCLYFFGYHLHNGVKCVIAKSSWGTSGNTTVHHIKQNYFDSGFMFNAYTLIPKGDTMNLVLDGTTLYLVGDKGKLGIADQASADLLKQLTASVQTASTASIPQIGILTHDDAFVIHK